MRHDVDTSDVGILEALAGASVVVDVAYAPSFEDKVVLLDEFQRMQTAMLLHALLASKR